MIQYQSEFLQWGARGALVVLFPFSALDKIVHWKAALKQANSSFLPGGGILLMSAIIIELLAPLMILLAWHDQVAACGLAFFCIVTAFLYHNFWSYSDFWSEDKEGRAHFWEFLKNFGLAGGLLLVAMGNTSF